MYFLDTSAVLELFRATEKGKSIENYIKDSIIAISSITVHELLVGLKEKEKTFMDNFLADVEVFDFNIKSAKESSKIERELKTSGKLINIMDILIASICKQKNLTLITCDKHFLKINNLNVKLF